MPSDIKQRVLRGNPKKPDGIERAFSRDEIENSSNVFVCDAAVLFGLCFSQYIPLPPHQTFLNISEAGMIIGLIRT